MTETSEIRPLQSLDAKSERTPTNSSKNIQQPAPSGIPHFNAGQVAKVKTKPHSKQRGNPSKLVPMVKGQTLNPGGRPKTKLLREHILELFHSDPDMCVKRLFEERIDLFMAYAFGKPADVLEISGRDGGAIKIQEAVELTDIQLLAIVAQKSN